MHDRVSRSSRPLAVHQQSLPDPQFPPRRSCRLAFQSPKRRVPYSRNNHIPDRQAIRANSGSLANRQTASEAGPPRIRHLERTTEYGCKLRSLEYRSAQLTPERGPQVGDVSPSRVSAFVSVSYQLFASFPPKPLEV